MASPAAPEKLTEAERVLQHRFLEARAAGMSLAESLRFAESTIDIGQLRLLVRGGCKPALIARIVT